MSTPTTLRFRFTIWLVESPSTKVAVPSAALATTLAPASPGHLSPRVPSAVTLMAPVPSTPPEKMPTFSVSWWRGSFIQAAGSLMGSESREPPGPTAWITTQASGTWDATSAMTTV